jgi:hypothetical protein
MKISVIDGSVEFEGGTVAPRMNRDAFAQTSLGRQSRRELVNKEWWHFHLKPEAGVGADVLYRDDVLHRIDIQMEIPSDSAGEWTEARELERKALHDDWLAREFGAAPYTYVWGEILSVYDAKGVIGEIIVRYDR